MSVHPWESDTAASGSGGALHEWERVGDDYDERLEDDDFFDPVDSDSEAEEPNPETDQRTAAMYFVELLISLYTNSKIGAWAVCSLAYWAWKMAGDVDCADLKRIAMDPKSKNQSRHLEIALGLRETKNKYLDIEVPGHARHALDRGTLHVKMDPPHEIMERQFAKDDALVTKALEIIPKLPPIYHQHPVVKSSPHEVVMWVGLYIDGVSYSLTDTVYGFWLINVLGGSRHLVCAIRKRLVCRCGCNGWCTWWPVLKCLKASFDQMASRIPHKRRYDGTEWILPRDSNRKALGDLGFLSYKSALGPLKGDWLQFCETFGFVSYASNDFPCFDCSSPKDSLYVLHGVSAVTMPFKLTLYADIVAAISRSEYRVTINTEAQYKRVCDALVYDKRPEVLAIPGLNMLPPLPPSPHPPLELIIPPLPAPSYPPSGG